MSRSDPQMLELLCLLVPELKAKVPATTLTISPLPDRTRIGSIFLAPPSDQRYVTRWRQQWHQRVTLADIDWLVASGYLSPMGNNSYWLNAEVILRACESAK